MKVLKTIIIGFIWILSVGNSFCQEEMKLKLLWEIPASQAHFDTTTSNVRTFDESIVSYRDSAGKIIFQKKIPDIVEAGREGMVQPFDSPNDRDLDKFGLKAAIQASGFSPNMEYYAQFTLMKDGELPLELFAWSDASNTYTLKWSNNQVFDQIKDMGLQASPEFMKVSDAGFVAVYTDKRMYACCNESPTNFVLEFDQNGKQIAYFHEGDEYFFDCRPYREKYIDAPRVSRGIFQSLHFSRDGRNLLVQGRSKSDENNHVFLLLNGTGEIIWRVDVPCLESNRNLCDSYLGNLLKASPSCETFILGGSIYMKNPPHLIQPFRRYAPTTQTYNDDESELIYNAGDNDVILRLFDFATQASSKLIEINSEVPLYKSALLWDYKSSIIYLCTKKVKKLPFGGREGLNDGYNCLRIISARQKSVLRFAIIPDYADEVLISRDHAIIFANLRQKIRLYSVETEGSTQ